MIYHYSLADNDYYRIDWPSITKPRHRNWRHGEAQHSEDDKADETWSATFVNVKNGWSMVAYIRQIIANK